jgi:hypothetical protein
MIILRDEKRIARFKKISQYTSIGGMLALLGGLVLAFTAESSQVFTYQLIALLVGWILSQVGIYLAHRYVRNPRPDQVLDEALHKSARNGRLYHYLLPAPHVLLNPDGVIVLVPKYQIGNISVENDKWKQSGIGLRRFFGQEGLGNPTKDAEVMIGSLANYIRKNAPDVPELPVGAVIVFTTKGSVELDVKNSTFPVMHYTKVKGFLKQQKRAPLSTAVYQSLRTAFDKAAVGLIEQTELENETSPA